MSAPRVVVDTRPKPPHRINEMQREHNEEDLFGEDVMRSVDVPHGVAQHPRAAVGADDNRDMERDYPPRLGGPYGVARVDALSVSSTSTSASIHTGHKMYPRMYGGMLMLSMQDSPRECVKWGVIKNNKMPVSVPNPKIGNKRSPTRV